MNKSIPPNERISTLHAAMAGDYLAQQAILNHFENYINRLSVVTIYSETGASHTYLDEDIRVQIQAKILESLMTFDLEGILKGRLPGKRTTKRESTKPRR